MFYLTWFISFSEDLSLLDGLKKTQTIVRKMRDMSLGKQLTVFIDLVNLKIKICLSLIFFFVDKLNECRHLEASLNDSEKTEIKFEHFDRIMPHKKTHEVTLMSKYVEKLCEEHSSNCLVDLGIKTNFFFQKIP